MDGGSGGKRKRQQWRDAPAAAASPPPPQMAFLPRSSPTAPPPRSPWVILGSIPRVLQGGGGGEAESADLSLALAAPPRVSHLSVSQRVFPDRPTPKYFPFVLGADPSGLLLLSAILYAPLTRVIDRPGDQPFISSRESQPRYFVLDATTGSAFHLPDPGPKETIENQALVGLIACPGGIGRYMVAEILLPFPMFCSHKAILRCYSSDLGEWVIKSVHYPVPPRPLAPSCTLAHHGRLWWVDYSLGIITADPFADDPVLRFVPLPRYCLLGYKEREALGVLDMFRYVGVSAGKLRFVNTFRRGGAPNKVTVWTLPDADATEWTLEHEATFADLWADDTYKATGLPKQAPVLGLIHPHNPAVVYFLLQDRLFGVDVRARMVVECDCYQAPPHNYPVAKRFIRAWELPPEVSSGPGNWSSDISSHEPTGAPPYRPMPGDYHMVGTSRMAFR